MLNIYYAGEACDKTKFIFDHIDPDQQTIILVPDQASLQMERDALDYFKDKCGRAALMDLMVADFSSLGHKVIKEAGGREPELIDKYGRQMLLSVLIDRLADAGDLSVYKTMKGKNSFVSNTNQLISEMKRSGVTSSDIEQAAGETDSYLQLKLSDICKIFRAYEDAILDRFTDTEDYIRFYGQVMEHSDLVQSSVIWITGFDTFTPVNMEVIQRLLMASPQVNVVMTWDAAAGVPLPATDARFLTTGGGQGLFDLTAFVMDELEKLAEAAGVSSSRQPVIGPFRRSIWNAGADAPATVPGNASGGAPAATDTAAAPDEPATASGTVPVNADSSASGIASGGAPAATDTAAAPDAPAATDTAASAPAPARAAADASTDTPPDAPAGRISLVQASNIYTEADRAAAFITQLVRDEGYRYRDIAIICNDMEVRGGVLQRTLERWSIPAFADRKRKVLHQPVVRFLLSFLRVISEGYSGDAVMEMISAGLLGFSRRDEELLSNYVSEGKILGNKWKQPFVWEGKDSYGNGRYTDDLPRLNEMRAFLVDTIEAAREEIGRRNTAEEKILGLNRFLENNFGILDRIEELIARQTEMGLLEGAAETAQSWSMICRIFTQVLRVIGEDTISNRQLRDILTEGLREMEIGLVPPAADSVIIGTLQRTRLSKCPVLIVTGANEGVLPMSGGDSGLLTQRELDRLEELRYSITKKDEIRRQEEQLAIYRMFSLPSEHLIVMCSMADQDGRSITPSAVFSVLAELDGVEVLGDLGKDDVTEQIASRRGSLSYMADAMQNYLENGRIDEAWLAAMNWYASQDPDSISKILQGLDFDNTVSRLEESFADSLYFGDRDAINVSASRLETYSSCPFRYFIEKGLRAEEPDAFETSGGSRGDVFHRALQVLSTRLTDAAKASFLAVTDPDSPWMTISEESCRAQIEEIIRSETADYREGVYLSDNETKLQLERIISICSDIAWAMIGQVRKSRVKDMFFEEPFGTHSRRLPPIEIELERGKKAVLSGFIDRLDILDIPAGSTAEADTAAPAADAAAGSGTADTAAPAGSTAGAPTEAIRIIDYKTGQDEINLEQIREGYKLQLMLYMNVAEQATGASASAAGGAASGSAAAAGDPAFAADGAAPAGVFYFKIKELDENIDKKSDTTSLGDHIEDRIAKSCRLEGIMVHDETILRAMDETIAPSETSTVLPVKKTKDGELKQTGQGELLTREEFDELCDITMDHVRQICRDIQSGRIDIEPKREKKTSGRYTKTSCTYCSYKSICLFDTSFRNCRYKLV